MATNRQVQRRRKFNNKRRMKRKGPSNKSLNKKIHHIENSLMELKYIDNFAGNQNLASAGTNVYLSDVAQGDTASDRTGNSVNPTSIHLRLEFFNDASSVVSTQARVVLFWDRQPNGAVPVLVGASTTQSLLDTGVVTNVMLAPRNFSTINRYTILWDKTYIVDAQEKNIANTAYIPRSKMVQKVKHLSRSSKYNGAAGTITTAVSNALHIAFFTDPTNANPGSFSYGTRLYYRDS